MNTKFKVGDKIVIQQKETHDEYVRNHYGKVLEIKEVIHADITLYKIKGVKNVATESDIEHAAYHFMTSDILFDIIDKAVSSIDGIDLEGKDLEWIRDYILDTAFTE